MSASLQSIRPGCLLGERPEKRSNSGETVVDLKLQQWWSMLAHKRPNIKSFDTELSAIKSGLNKLSQTEPQKFSRHVTKLRRLVASSGLNDTIVCHAFSLIALQLQRHLGITPHDEQYFAAWHMLRGTLAEMNTGEGKTLTIAFPAIVMALTGTPVHVITVNDYLVHRDAKLLEQIYRQFGLTVAVVSESMNDELRREAYAADIVYCTNKQIVFDYLRDSQRLGSTTTGLNYQLRSLLSTDQVAPIMRGLCFAIVDEADSVLIDDARIPLILSEQKTTGKEKNTESKVAMGIARTLHEDIDFKLEKTTRVVHLTDTGLDALEKLAKRLSGVWQIERYRSELIKQALTAQHIYRCDRDYVVIDKKVSLIDEGTGRAMPDRKLPNGLHRMIEIKEKCQPTDDTETLASISYQRFFLKYHKLAGLSGTLHEVRGELRNVYQLEVVRVPAHKPSRITMLPQTVLPSRSTQIAVLLKTVQSRHAAGQPILIGTRTVALSERISHVLKACKIEHQLLNATQDKDEAMIVARAGRPGAVTVATNMAGRGTDIPLQGSAIDLGGLHVINTEINDTARIDRQLFGRAARQGEPGSAHTILSATDELLNELPAIIRRLLPSTTASRRSCLLCAWIVRSVQWRCERRQMAQRISVFKGYKQLKRQLAVGGNLD